MKNFIEHWLNKGDEKSDTQKFWLELLHEVLKIEEPTKIIEFEKRVSLEHTSFIDAYIPKTRIIIEQKSIDINLDKPAKMSDETFLTPFEQAKRYSDWLPDSEHARWIITCNFQEFQVHDMEHPKAPPEIIKLENLESEWRKFLFLIDPGGPTPKDIREEKISIEGGKLVRKLKESLETRYRNSSDEEKFKKQKRDLTILCVRIVFLLYAEDSGLFEKAQFHDYLKARENTARDALIKLFDILNTKIEDRDPYLEEDEKNFPYVNGGLFADIDKKKIEIPRLDAETLEIILREMSEGFDWSGINPPIFGAIFERVLSDEERESGGMHYTTVENIHKVIDPLFLDELKTKLENIFAMPKGQERTQNLLAFQNKLAALRFLDPACGSGNFLTESFKSLRTLENKILSELSKQPDLKEKLEIKVSISQFHGIEANDFAVAVARTALWIADNQMWKAARDFINETPLPLKEYDHIKYGSAMDKLEGVAWGLPGWKIYHDDMLYIMGNPPFLGYSQQDKGQKEEVRKLLGSGKVDYVACWFAVASEYLQDKNTKAAFVATNSITQGEQVAAIFKYLHENWGIEIDFAYQPFVWDSELKDLMAHVHVVIIGFSTTAPKLRKLYTPEGLKLVENINFYLKPAPNFFIEAHKEPICKDAPRMKAGGKPAEGGNLILTLEERDKLLKKNPLAKKFIRPFMGADDFLQRKPRYCLWLIGANPDDIKKCPLVMKRIKAVKNFRLASKKGATKRKAESPTLFDERVEMTANYIAIPETSSSGRTYIPIDWLDASIISSNTLRIIPNVSLYHFGILTSRVHMAWMRLTAGRFGMGYRYSNTIVYNNFVWPGVNDKQRAKIEQTAQKILDARAKYPESSFASLYNDDLMPPELKRAHKENDAAVCEAYGFAKNISEEEIVSELMRLYINVIK
ncbi:MAG: N-6 DNA methylase [Synergistaceae bacterium]|nr:N-6 DNA methylase [Synergistaceae bacterium]